MRVAIGMATLWRHVPAEAFDGWVSEFGAAEARAIVIVDAGDSGWTRGDPGEARVAIEAFARGWDSAAADARERLDNGFAAVRRAFEGRPTDELVGGPWASLIAALITDGRVVIRWIGPGEAMLVRDGTVTDRSLGHTLCGELIRKGQLAENERATFDDIVVRAIAADSREVAAEAVEWSLNPGDAVVLLDGRTAHLLTRDAVVRTLCATHGDPDAGARELIAACERRADFFRGSAVVVSLLQDGAP